MMGFWAVGLAEVSEADQARRRVRRAQGVEMGLVAILASFVRLGWEGMNVG